MNYDLRLTNRKKKNIIYDSIFMIRNSGFTLIELLIVVAVIGILATLLMVNFVGVRQRARDAQRKANIQQLQSALELYRADQGSYPVVNGAPYRIVACGSAFTSGSTTYSQKVPCDPLGAGASTYNSGDYYYSSGGASYTIGGCLENPSDTDQNATKTSPGGSGCATINADASTGFYYVLNNP